MKRNENGIVSFHEGLLVLENRIKEEFLIEEMFCKIINRIQYVNLTKYKEVSKMDVTSRIQAAVGWRVISGIWLEAENLLHLTSLIEKARLD